MLVSISFTRSAMLYTGWRVSVPELYLLLEILLLIWHFDDEVLFSVAQLTPEPIKELMPACLNLCRSPECHTRWTPLLDPEIRIETWLELISLYIDFSVVHRKWLLTHVCCTNISVPFRLDFVFALIMLIYAMGGWSTPILTEEILARLWKYTTPW